MATPRGLFESVRRAVKGAADSAQEVLEVLQPGALPGSVRWDARLRADAARAVDGAVARWRAENARFEREEGGGAETGQQQQQQQQQQHSTRRRLLLAGGAGCAWAAAAAPPPAVASPEGDAAAAAALLRRAVGPAGDVRQPGPPLPFAPRQSYYPKWMFGEWDVRSRFSGFSAPLGPRFVRPELLAGAEAPKEDGGVGSDYEFRARYYSTLPDTLANRTRVNLGFLPQDAIIPDRAFNARAAGDGYLGPGAVGAAAYDPTEAPDRLTLEYSRVGEDMRPLPPRRVELYIQRIQAGEVPVEYDEDGAPLAAAAAGGADGAAEAWPPLGAPCFVLSEMCRQVTLGVRQADVQDYEIVTAFALTAPGRVSARQRTLLYLEPRDELFFSARGRAVAVYEYDLEFERVPVEGAIACVDTPKSVTQCI
ncbi:hypothetical protein Rsub_12787 [Raphidocelis subcapitata]|uniref:DUF6816 domain-containing protein n=1 Tax=Raphidocelis subcapitata TaxID=307507 RepID=A0A2V0PJN4_9CHLO|nr:hypothetical protein Rsub_12787 [Raphidocelis subcapitata]|eukprot:GBG00009.1 hypothetical protein Rsub_12787 [Raphidocelis subcapitata]